MKHYLEGSNEVGNGILFKTVFMPLDPDLFNKDTLSSILSSLYYLNISISSISRKTIQGKMYYFPTGFLYIYQMLF